MYIGMAGMIKPCYDAMCNVELPIVWTKQFVCSKLVMY